MTKSKGIGRGGPRKGAGRKRFTKTGKTENFSTRITPETREFLDIEARRHDLSVSVVAEHLLLIGLKEMERRRQPTGPLRALCFLLPILAKQMLGAYLMKIDTTRRTADADPEHTWRSTPYLFEAFRSGVLTLIDQMRPPGEVVTPEPVAMPEPSRPFRFPDDPRHYGNRCAANVIDVAHSVKRSIEFSMVEMDLDSRLNSLSMAARRQLVREEEYDLLDAWNDAGLKGAEDYGLGVSGPIWREDDGGSEK
jgi:hypothetical protein